MRDRPAGAQLLRLARGSLLDILTAALPEEDRHTARLVANAMAIAAREMESGEADRIAEREGLEELFGEAREDFGAAAEAESLDETLERLNWRLTAEIRAGGRDADPRVHALLGQGTAARLKIVNPRALAGERGGDPR